MSGPEIYDRPTTLPYFRDLPDAPPVVAEPPPADDGVDNTQREDVLAAIDDVLPADATAQERRAAIDSLQGQVNAVASGGDYEVIDADGMRLLAVLRLGVDGIPTRFDPRVVDAVEQQLSPDATQAQEWQALQDIQAYVDGVGGIGDAGIVAEALPERTATLLQEAGLPTVAADARAEAERILDVGVRDNWLPGNQEDDYGARFDAFRESISGKSDAYQQHLIDALLEQDSGALNSWLTVDRLVSAHRDGELANDTFAHIAETMADAYNEGRLSDDAFDDMIDLDDGETQAREYGQMLEFLSALGGDEAAELRGTLAERSFEQWNASQYPTDNGYHAYNLRHLTFALELAAGDPSRPEILTDLLAGLDAQTLGKVVAIGGQLPDAPTDLMQTIFSTVAADTRPQAAELAVQLARLPGEHADWFAQDQTGRNEALARMLATHDGAILDALSENNLDGARTTAEGGTDLSQREANGRDLAALLQLTTLNPGIDASARTAAREAVLGYVGEQAAVIEQSRNDPNSAGYEEASGRITVLAAATDVAISNGFESLRADREAQKEAIAFAVDLALTALPLPSRLSDRTSTGIAALFGEGSLVSDALGGLSGEIIDQGTGLLTDAAKEQLYANLDDPELADLLEQQTMADLFRGNILTAVADERDRTQIANDAASLADDISEG
jgi:hypothetical protein